MFKGLFNHRQPEFGETYLPNARWTKDLVRLGTRDGKREMSEDQSPTAAERDVLAHYQSIGLQRRASAERAIAQSVSRAQRRKALPTHAEIEGVRDGYVTALKAIATKIRAKMETQWHAVREAYTELEQFRINEGIDRKAVYPESAINHYGTIFLLVLFEAILNSWFYGSASPDGLGAGLLMAVIISMILVASSVGAGVLVRGLFAANTRRRTVAMITIPAYASLAIFLSLAAASYRDTLAQDIDLTGVMGPISEIMKSPLSLSFESVLLFAFALGASALALYKGVTADEILGHGPLDRAYRTTHDAYVETWTTANEYVVEVQETANSALDEMIEHAETPLNARIAALPDARAAVESYESLAVLLQAGYTYAVQTYRDAVDCTRHSVSKWPEPQMIECAPPAITAIETAEAAVETDKNCLDEVRKLVSEAKKQITIAAAEMQAELEAYRTALEHAVETGVRADSPKLALAEKKAA